MKTITVTFTLTDDYASLLSDAEADMAQELADLLRFRLATIIRVEWRDDVPLIIGAEEVTP